MLVGSRLEGRGGEERRVGCVVVVLAGNRVHDWSNVETLEGSFYEEVGGNRVIVFRLVRVRSCERLRGTRVQSYYV